MNAVLRLQIGLLAIGDGDCALVQPCATFVPLSPLSDQKRAWHVVRRDDVNNEVRRALDLFDPVERVPEAQPLDRLMVETCPLVIVSDEVRAELVSRDVRVWTVGYHRTPDLLFVAGAGGDAPMRWAATPYDMSRAGHTQIALVDRVLRAATGGAIDEPSLMLAAELQRLGWDDWSRPVAERAHARQVIEMVRDDPEEARACFYDSLQSSFARHFGARSVPPYDEATVRTVRAMRTASGPEEVRIEDAGVFRRESSPEVVVAIPNSPDDWVAKWFTAFDVVAIDPFGATSRVLRIPTAYRYVRRGR